jgi:hypothetical protein
VLYNYVTIFQRPVSCPLQYSSIPPHAFIVFLTALFCCILPWLLFQNIQTHDPRHTSVSATQLLNAPLYLLQSSSTHLCISYTAPQYTSVSATQLLNAPLYLLQSSLTHLCICYTASRHISLSTTQLLNAPLICCTAPQHISVSATQLLNTPLYLLHSS